jgi:hypothetical protein
VILKSESFTYGFFATEIADVGHDFHAQYGSAAPFPHIVLDNFMDDRTLELCLNEFPNNETSKAGYVRKQENLKWEFSPETLPPTVRSLFYSFNSKPFVRFIENVTGINGLVPDPYFLGGGFHEVAQGGHLSIHADFNYHQVLRLERRVNVLIYLNKDWKQEYGGCLEIWDQQMLSCRVRVVPLFNRCVIFNTSSTSFHGNPEPVNHPAGTSRRSIALYYYTATWDASGRARTTHFRARPESDDRFDLAVQTQEFLRDITPPVMFRTLTRIGRVARRRSRRVLDAFTAWRFAEKRRSAHG